MEVRLRVVRKWRICNELQRYLRLRFGNISIDCCQSDGAVVCSALTRAQIVAAAAAKIKTMGLARLTKQTASSAALI